MYSRSWTLVEISNLVYRYEYSIPLSRKCHKGITGCSPRGVNLTCLIIGHISDWSYRWIKCELNVSWIRHWVINTCDIWTIEQSIHVINEDLCNMYNYMHVFVISLIMTKLSRTRKLNYTIRNYRHVKTNKRPMFYLVIDLLAERIQSCSEQSE